MSWMFHPVTLWLMATRLSGWMVISPGFTEINSPQLVRAYMVIWLTILLMPIIQPVDLVINSIPQLAFILVTEFAIGAGYGLVLRMIFSAVQFGGTLIDSELGYLYAQQVNPFTPISGGIFGRLFMLIGLLYFWLFDYFRVVVEALYQSFVIIPLGSLSTPAFDIQRMTFLTAGIFSSGLIIAAPVMALMFFVTISVGFLARTVQGINIFSETFILKIVVGILGVWVFLPLLFLLVKIQMEKIIPLSSEYFRSFIPSPN